MGVKGGLKIKTIEEKIKKTFFGLKKKKKSEISSLVNSYTCGTEREEGTETEKKRLGGEGGVIRN